MNGNSPAEGEEDSPPRVLNKDRWLSLGAWVLALAVVVLASALGWQRWGTQPFQPEATRFVQITDGDTESLALPDLQEGEGESISRQVEPDTVIPTRSRQTAEEYAVVQGDSVFAIAVKFSLEPETVLWANFTLLSDNPDFLAPGMVLTIPPVDGIYYQWEAGDTLESVAAKFEASKEDILNWSGNNLDLIEPQVDPGRWVMIPGGKREFVQWIIPVIPSGSAGVSKEVYGPGACEGGYEGIGGTGGFIWPTDDQYVVGNDYWSGHLGIDLAANVGSQIYAADSGIVVFSGWANGGYGNMIMIDHGNGYYTVYAHLSEVYTICGQSVVQGAAIGQGGSTGNSTGPHLHFEVRYLGGFVNPWFVLP